MINIMNRDIQDRVMELKIEMATYIELISDVENEISDIMFSRNKTKIKKLFDLYSQSEILRYEWLSIHTTYELLKTFQEPIN